MSYQRDRTAGGRFILGLAILLLVHLPFSGGEGLGAEPAEGLERGWTFEAAPGIFWGQLGEYVYSGGDTLSYLEWELKPLPVGIWSLEGQLSCGFYGGTEMTVGLPGRTGLMKDSDWDPEAAWYDKDKPDKKTHYSEHDTYLKGALLADVYAGWGWQLTEELRGRCSAGFFYSSFSLSARDGFTQYPPSSKPVNVHGTVVDYHQITTQGYLGTAWLYRFSPRFTLELAGSGAPLVFVRTLDNHFLRNKDFYGILNWGFAYTAGGEAVVEDLPGGDLVIGLGVRGMLPVKGYTVIEDTMTGDVSQTKDGTEGASYLLGEFSLGYRF